MQVIVAQVRAAAASVPGQPVLPRPWSGKHMKGEIYVALIRFLLDGNIQLFTGAPYRIALIHAWNTLMRFRHSCL